MRRYYYNWGWYPGIQQIPPRPAVCSGYLYTIKSGETLSLIAARYGLTVARIMAANPQLTNPNLIYPGQVICIPVGAPTCPDGTLYTVVRGDTLFAIAQRYNVTVAQILAVNPQIVNPNLLFIGQQICIPVPPVTPPPEEEPELVVPCPIILARENDVDEEVSGLAFIAPHEDGYSITFVGLHLPAPDTLGEFDGYLGSFIAEADGATTSVELELVEEEGAPDTWVGTVVAAGLAVGDTVVIRPFRDVTDGDDVIGSNVLAAVIDECFIEA